MLKMALKWQNITVTNACNNISNYTNASDKYSFLFDIIFSSGAIAYAYGKTTIVWDTIAGIVISYNPIRWATFLSVTGIFVTQMLTTSKAVIYVPDISAINTVIDYSYCNCHYYRQ